MSKDDFYMPIDIDALRMENELLTFEVSFLKAQLGEAGRLENRLKESERSVARLESQLAESKRAEVQSKRAEAQSKRAEKKSRNEESRRAEKDLVRLLRILGSSRLRWFFGLKQELRVLEQRYLDTDA